jgi:ATP-dependent RNA helicase SUPV3L1/SUV3
MDEVPHLAASGRTSFPADKEVSKALYRVVGYRVCGERAVRVDILERLADLIRPAMAWKPGAPGVKPAGAVEGGGFTVTVAMTSLTGAAGEDFASILRSLGYRAERRPKPAEPEAARSSAPPAAEAAGGEPAPAVGDAGATAEAATPDATAPEAPEAPPAPAPAAVETAADPATAALASESSPGEAAAVAPEAVAPEAAAPDAAAPDAAAPASETAPAASAEEAFIEVWRPGRPEGARRDRPRAQRRGQRAPEQRPSAEAPQPAAASATPAAAPAEAAKTAKGAAKPPRPPRKPRPDRPPREPRESRGRPVFATSAKERRDKAPDPNSPFAKLAALKEQLEANAKERR